MTIQSTDIPKRFSTLIRTVEEEGKHLLRDIESVALRMRDFLKGKGATSLGTSHTTIESTSWVEQVNENVDLLCIYDETSQNKHYSFLILENERGITIQGYPLYDDDGQNIHPPFCSTLEETRKLYPNEPIHYRHESAHVIRPTVWYYRCHYRELLESTPSSLRPLFSVSMVRTSYIEQMTNDEDFQQRLNNVSAVSEKTSDGRFLVQYLVVEGTYDLLQMGRACLFLTNISEYHAK